MDVIVNVLVKRGTKVLMVQENWGDVKGMWNFPAGHLAFGENIFQGAIREVKEETGFDVVLTGIVDIQNMIFENKHVLHVCFLADVVGGEVLFDVKEIKCVEFMDIEEILNMSDKQLRGAIGRKNTLLNLKCGVLFPLAVVSNIDLKHINN